MSSFVTQCPHCQTSFRVSRAQLAAARGVVRCGACMELFNAARYLQGSDTEDHGEPTSAVTASAPAKLHVAASQAQSTATEAGSNDTLWIHDDLDLDSLDLDEELAKLERQEREFSREPLSLEPAPDERPTTDGERSLLSGEEPLQVTPSTIIEHESQLLPRREPADSTEGLQTTDLRFTPVSREYAEQPSPLLASRESRAQPGGSEQRIEPSLDTLDGNDDLQAHPERSVTRDDAAATTLLHPTREEDDPLFDLEDEPLQLEWEARRRPWGRWLGWGALNLIALLVLAAQYATYNLDGLARQDEYRPWLERICPVVGCELPARVDISQIRSSNLVVRSHPDFAGALIVDAMIYNRAPFAQPFPLLEVRFDDMQGKTLAQRTFKPGEYLSGELAGRREMPSQIPIHISLDILDPGSKAVNYSLSFRSPD